MAADAASTTYKSRLLRTTTEESQLSRTTTDGKPAAPAPLRMESQLSRTTTDESQQFRTTTDGKPAVPHHYGWKASCSALLRMKASCSALRAPAAAAGINNPPYRATCRYRLARPISTSCGMRASHSLCLPSGAFIVFYKNFRINLFTLGENQKSVCYTTLEIGLPQVQRTSGDQRGCWS